MLIRILEVTRVASPERVLGWLYDSGTRRLSLCHHRINLGFGSSVVTQGKFRGTRHTNWKPSVARKTFTRPERKSQPGLKLKERNRPNLKLLTNDPFRF